MSTTAVLNLGINTKQFQKGLASASSSLAGFTLKATAGLALVGAGVAGAMAVAGVSFIKAAADADETKNKFNSVFAGINGKAEETAKNLAKNFGLSSRESKKLLGDTGDLLSGFGFATDSALDFSQQVQELASDLTSFQNFQGGVEGASQAITAALTGETEKMKALGVVIRQGTAEYKNNVKALMANKNLTELQAKATENLRIITEQSKNSIGDYAKTSKQLANQMKLTAKIWDDLKIAVGRFLSEFLGAEGVVLSFNDKFKSVTENVKGFLANWQENFKRVTDWIGDNFATLFLSDIPRMIELSFTNTLTNIRSFGVIVTDIFNVITTQMGKDLGDNLLSGFKSALAGIAKANFEFVKSTAKGLFFTTGIGAFFKKEADEAGDNAGKTFSEKLAIATKESLAKIKFKSLLDNFVSKSKELKLKLNIDKNDLENKVKKTVGEIQGKLSGGSGYGSDLGLIGLQDPKEYLEDLKNFNLGISGLDDEIKGTSKAKSKASTEFGGAFEKGSVDAYKVINQSTGNKTEIESLNVQKQIASNTSRNSQPQTLVMA